MIVGAGPIGLACAISARRRGLDPLVIDAGAIADAIVRYPIGMTFFTTPDRLEIGGHPLVTSGAKATREEALAYYRGVARVEGLRVRTYTRLIGTRREAGKVVCRLMTGRGEEEIFCDRLVLATGYFDHPNRLEVPGEDLPHVSHWFDEAHRTAGLDVVIVGAKNSAVEAALLCFRAGARVTIVSRHPEFRPTVKYWLRPDIENRIAADEIAIRWDATVREVTPEYVEVERNGGRERLPADRVYALTGFHPDFALFRSMGIALDPETLRPSLSERLETNVPGIHMAGSIAAGRKISEVFIENGRWDGEKIFGDPASADARYEAQTRAQDE